MAETSKVKIEIVISKKLIESLLVVAAYLSEAATLVQGIVKELEPFWVDVDEETGDKMES
jgi:hypothetical protein